MFEKLNCVSGRLWIVAGSEDIKGRSKEQFSERHPVRHHYAYNFRKNGHASDALRDQFLSIAYYRAQKALCRTFIWVKLPTLAMNDFIAKLQHARIRSIGNKPLPNSCRKISFHSKYQSSNLHSPISHLKINHHPHPVHKIPPHSIALKAKGMPGYSRVKSKRT